MSEETHVPYTTIGDLLAVLGGHNSNIEVRLIDPAVGDVPLDNIDFEDGSEGRVVLLSSNHDEVTR